MSDPHSMSPATDWLARASSPTQQHAYRDGPRIVAIETLIPHDIMAGLLLLRIHTDAGTVHALRDLDLRVDGFCDHCCDTTKPSARPAEADRAG